MANHKKYVSARRLGLTDPAMDWRLKNWTRPKAFRTPRQNTRPKDPNSLYQVALALGLNPGTIYSRIKRGMTRFEALMA